MPHRRDILTPANLALLQLIAQHGSFAAAARQLGLVPSALTYRVRQIEDELDVLLFDRGARHASLTDAGTELLRESAVLLAEMDHMINRVHSIASGWEAQLTIAIDSVIVPTVLWDLCAQFDTLGAPTRLVLQRETLSGTLAALTHGGADLAIGVALDDQSFAGLERAPLGTVEFVFAVAPHHPLAHQPEPLSDTLLQKHRAVVVADSNRFGASVSVGLLPAQDTLTVRDMASKLAAQLQGLGCGFLPRHIAAPYLQSGKLIAKTLQRHAHDSQHIACSYAWRTTPPLLQRRALAWWLAQLGRSITRAALLDNT